MEQHAVSNGFIHINQYFSTGICSYKSFRPSTVF